MRTSAELELELTDAKRREQHAEVLRRIEKDRQEREAIRAEQLRYEAKENEKLSQLVDKTIQAIRFDVQHEGSLTFTFTDGTDFYVSASGDDMTSIHYGFGKQGE
jgi:predicted phage gp36 major capsid-like protein